MADNVMALPLDLQREMVEIKQKNMVEIIILLQKMKIWGGSYMEALPPPSFQPKKMRTDLEI